LCFYFKILSVTKICYINFFAVVDDLFKVLHLI